MSKQTSHHKTHKITDDILEVGETMIVCCSTNVLKNSLSPHKYTFPLHPSLSPSIILSLSRNRIHDFV